MYFYAGQALSHIAVLQKQQHMSINSAMQQSSYEKGASHCTLDKQSS